MSKEYTLREEFDKRTKGVDCLDQEECLNVLKYAIIQNIDGSWGDGLEHLTKIKILHKAFPDDKLLKRIHDYLVEKIERAVNHEMDSPSAYDWTESCLRDEPYIVEYVNDERKVIFDVNNNHVLKKIRDDHKEFDEISHEVYWW